MGRWPCVIVSNVKAWFLFWIAVIATSATAGAQEFDRIELQRIAAGLHYADGPLWSYEGYLIFSDVPVDRMHKWTGTSLNIR